MKKQFRPISVSAYVDRHLQANPHDRREEVLANVQRALRAYHGGVRCLCGNPIWVVGSAMAGNACFTCITGETDPSGDFEIDQVGGKDD